MLTVYRILHFAFAFCKIARPITLKLIKMYRMIVASITNPIVDLRLGLPLTASFSSSAIQFEKISMKYEVMRVKNSFTNSCWLSYGFS